MCDLNLLVKNLRSRAEAFPAFCSPVCDKAADAIETLQSFKDDVVAGCDIQKGKRLYRQVLVIIGPGETQAEIDLKTSQAHVAKLEEALADLTHGLPKLLEDIGYVDEENLVGKALTVLVTK